MKTTRPADAPPRPPHDVPSDPTRALPVTLSFPSQRAIRPAPLRPRGAATLASSCFPMGALPKTPPIRAIPSRPAPKP